MPMRIMRVRLTGAHTRLRQMTARSWPLGPRRRRPHWDDTRSACCNMFPPLLATLVLIQSVARDGLKTALALAILLALFGALAAALVWWPWARPDEQARPAASAEDSPVSPTPDVVPVGAPAQGHFAAQAVPLLLHSPSEERPWV
jgi:hypothetical protein